MVSFYHTNPVGTQIALFLQSSMSYEVLEAVQARQSRLEELSI